MDPLKSSGRLFADCFFRRPASHGYFFFSEIHGDLKKNLGFGGRNPVCNSGYWLKLVEELYHPLTCIGVNGKSITPFFCWFSDGLCVESIQGVFFFFEF